MSVVGIHASHEQFLPSRLLAYMQQAERLGFRAGMCSDHFHPWSEDQGQSGFSWTWLGATLQATDMTIGVVCAPGQRYHPAIVAQAAATLAEMFPGRFWIAVGSGEALNERITGEPWPVKAQRNQRLKESVDVMRRLWAGETVNHDGAITVRNAKLYTRPAKPPKLYLAAISAETAEWGASWADGMITVGAQAEGLKKNVEAFRRGGGEGKPVILQSAVCFGPNEKAALESAHTSWRHAALDPGKIADTETPVEFDAATREVTPNDLKDKLRISADIDEHLHWIESDLELGFDQVYLHHVGSEIESYLEALGKKVVPYLRQKGLLSVH